MAKDAKPDRYVVERRGSPDPQDSEYYVLDLVHDHFAREVAWMLVRKYRSASNGTSVRADELEKLLNDTNEPFIRNIEARNPGKNRVGRPQSARPRR